MARMMPAFVDDHTPPGERDVFNMLAAGPDDWVALHSLDLAPWNRRLRTEIDFVVVIPSHGIICIEVKSHSRISFDGFAWFPSEFNRRTPFKQALDGKHTFYRHLKEIVPAYSNTPVIHMCIFPNADFNVRSNLSIRAFELMDRREFRAFNAASRFCDALVGRISESIRHDPTLSQLGKALTSSQIERIVQICIPVQRRKPEAQEVMESRAREVERILLEQQRPILHLATTNPRLIVSGGAGTGKTLIALELARRLAETGSRVALLCFNKLIGDWLSERMAGIVPPMPNLVVGRAIHVMVEMTGLAIQSDPGANYWNNVLPSDLEEKLTDPNFQEAALFDYIVLDEAQDILVKSRLWDCLIQFLRGGLREGGFALFGDFDYQVLGESDILKTTLDNVKREGHPVWYRLSENCRNYRIVGDMALKLSGIKENVYSGFLRVGGGLPNYGIHFYSSEEEQLSTLAKWLNEFGEQGYAPSEITVLSFINDENCASEALLKRGYSLVPAKQGGRKRGRTTSFCTVHAFKGMENKVIIITDVSLAANDIGRNLFYTGLTRALESVRILCDVRSKPTLLEWLRTGGTNV